MIETWVSAPGYEGLYDVSDLGRVRSLPRMGKRCMRIYGGRLLRQAINRSTGYWSVILTKDSVQTAFNVHRLVLLAFRGPPLPWEETCHNDGDPGNNALSNLRWDTRSGNFADKKLHGTGNAGIKHYRSKFTPDEIRTIRGMRGSRRFIATQLGVSPTCVQKIQDRKSYTDVA